MWGNRQNAPVPSTFPESNVSFSDLWGRYVGLALWLRSCLLQDTYTNKVKGHTSVMVLVCFQRLWLVSVGSILFLLFPTLHRASLSVYSIVFKLQHQAWRGQPDRLLSQFPQVLLLWLNSNLHIGPQCGIGPRGRVVWGAIFCPPSPDEAGL